MSGWVGVDFDGTLAEYHGWNEEGGPPVPIMVRRVQQWLKEGIPVKIFTARVSIGGSNEEDQRKMIEDWCQQHIGQVLPVTCVKDLSMIELWDDRAVRVEHNTGLVDNAYVGRV